MIYWIIIFFLLLDFVYKILTNYLNYRSYSNKVPEELENIYSPEEYDKHLQYSKVKMKFSMVMGVFNFAVILLVFASGFFGVIDTLVKSMTPYPVLQCISFFIIFLTLDIVLDIFPSAYKTFVIEEQFGFNRSTPKTFIKDTIIGFLVATVLISLLVGLCSWIYSVSPEYFWLYATLVIVTYSLVMSYLYSDIIVPLFNKQTPLEEGELRDKIFEFAESVGFQVSDIYVMDGSKRSTKANAYFTGFGNKKRIVLYDTLIEQLTTDEIVAVLSHEVGHYKHNHIWKGEIISAVKTLFGMLLLSLVLGNDKFAISAGAECASFQVNLVVFSFILIPLNILFSAIECCISRSFEWEADEFAKVHGFGEAISNGLKKLTKNNLANLTPNKFIVFMEYSHPTLYDRVLHMKENSTKHENQ